MLLCPLKFTMVMGLSGFMLTLFLDFLGNNSSKGDWERDFSILANPSVVAPEAVVVDESSGHSYGAKFPPPESATIRAGTDWSHRTPSRIAELAKHQGLKKVN